MSSKVLQSQFQGMHTEQQQTYQLSISKWDSQFNFDQMWGLVPIINSKERILNSKGIQDLILLKKKQRNQEKVIDLLWIEFLQQLIELTEVQKYLDIIFFLLNFNSFRTLFRFTKQSSIFAYRVGAFFSQFKQPQLRELEQETTTRLWEEGKRKAKIKSIAINSISDKFLRIRKDMESVQKSSEDLVEQTSELSSNTEISGEEIDEATRLAKEKRAQKLHSARVYEFSKRLARGIEVVIQKEKCIAEELFEFASATDLSAARTSKDLIVIHFGTGDEADFYTVREFVSNITKSARWTIFPGLTYGFISCENSEIMESVLASCETIHGIENCHFKELTFEKKTRAIFFLPSRKSLNDLTASSQGQIQNVKSVHDVLPGLSITPEFVSKEKEGEIVLEADKKPWINLAKKSVQHYGYEYLFGINAIDRESKKEAIPEHLTELVKRINSDVLHGESEIDQLTIQSFSSGDGVPPYIDSHASIDEKIVVVSLNSGVVLTLKSYKNEETQVYVPARSVMVLSGEVRYAWFSSVSSRKVDIIDEEMVFRRRRVALFFRTAAKKKCTCDYKFFCEDQGYDPITMKKKNPLLPKDYHAKSDSTKVVAPKNDEELEIIESAKLAGTENKPTQLEQRYVYEVYEKIAPHFSHSRYGTWPKIEEFITSLAPGSLVADIGCGNGKYLDCHKGDIFMIGTDRSENLISLAKQRGEDIQVFSADSLKLPWVSGKFDNAISIAVIHHFSTPELRIHAIKEILRILRVNGEALIYVWAFEQTEKSFSEQDVFVPWNLQNKYEDEKVVKGESKPNTDISINESKQTVVYKRYYHVFKKGELEGLISTIKNCTVEDGYYDHANWVVRIKKTHDEVE